MTAAMTNAIKDLLIAFSKINLALMLGWQDIKQRYRRSRLGPFWITISMGVMISMIGIVFGQVLDSPMEEYLPFLATGLILWTFFSTSILEGSNSFIDAKDMVRQLSLPLSLYPLRVIWRNVVICGHNLLILPFVFLFVGKGFSWEFFWLIPGFCVFVLNAFWLSIFLSVFCTRFRDMPQIINSLLQVFFYVTPVLWMPNLLSPRSSSLIVDTNPVYHLMELVRAPILGNAPTLLNWQVSLGIAFVGSILTLILFGIYKKRIAYWL